MIAPRRSSNRLLAGAAVLVVPVAAAGIIWIAPAAASLLGIAPDPPPPPGDVVEIGGGVRLNVLTDGNGPPMVLVHGLGGNAYDWQDFVYWMTGGHVRTIRYDRVGYGYSDRRPPGAIHDVDANARELIQLVEALELRSPIAVGWSFGGGVVMRAAELSPGIFERIVLLSSVGPQHPGPRHHTSMPFAGGSRPRRWLFDTGLVRLFAARQAARAFSPAPVKAEWLDRNISLMALPGAVDTYLAEQRDDHADQLRPDRLDVPVLIIHGTGDRMVSIEVAEDLADRIPGSRLVRIELAGHMLPQTHAEPLATRIRVFVRDNQPR